MTRNRGLNQRLLQRCKILKESEFYRSPVAGDRALAILLDVDWTTIGNWRREGIIPWENYEGSSINIYKLRDVIEALETFAENRDRDYKERMEAFERAANLIELQDKVDKILDLAYRKKKKK